jgi:hypothetical protein
MTVVDSLHQYYVVYSTLSEVGLYLCIPDVSGVEPTSVIR